MKKVKIMLTAITVFAVVGGALAFKAQKFNSHLFCSGGVSHKSCDIRVDGITTTNALGFNQSNCTINSTTKECALTSTKDDE